MISPLVALVWMTRHARSVARSRAPLEHLEVSVREGATRHGWLCASETSLVLARRGALALQLAAVLRREPEPVATQAALELVHSILDVARARSCEHRVAGQPRRLAQAALLALHRDLSVNRSISELAEELGCSPYHLMHAFRAELGEPMRAYRQRARLGVALHRLVDGHDDLCTLAIELGFASHSHFTETFTRELGISPSRLRAQLQGGPRRSDGPPLQSDPRRR